MTELTSKTGEHPLNQEQLKKLSYYIENNSKSSTQDLIKHVNTEYKMDCDEDQIIAMINHLGFIYEKPEGSKEFFWTKNNN